MLKSNLRTLYKQKRKQLKINNDQIIANLPLMKANQLVGIYYPLKYELDCLNLGYQLQKKYKIQLALPYLKDENMFYSLYNKDMVFELGTLNIQQPQQPIQCWPELCLLPLLAFDPVTKHRLGYGGGFVDKFIEYIKKNQIQCQLIGLGHEELICQDLEIEDHDQALDYIVTDKQLY